MIGRPDQPVKPFAPIHWARHQGHREHMERCKWCEVAGKTIPPTPSRPPKLTRTALQILLLLATYANTERIAWPSIERLALEAGLKVKRRTRIRPDGTKFKAVECSAVTAALQELEENGLIWSRQAGRRSPERELLMPLLPADTGSKSLLPVDTVPAPRPHGGEVPRKASTSTSTSKDQETLPAEAGSVRKVIRESLDSEGVAG